MRTNSILKFVALAFIVGHLSFIVWLGFWAGTITYFGVWLVLALALVAKPSHELPPAS